MNYLKRKILTLILFCISFGLHAQQATVSAGGEASGSGGTVNYTVGQVMYTTSMGNNGTVVQGVQQPYEIFEVIGISEIDISLKISVYPNPTTDYLTLGMTDVLKAGYEQSQLMYQLYDIEGKLLQKQENIAVESQIQMSAYKQGTYFLNIMKNNKQIKIFKIIKK